MPPVRLTDSELDAVFAAAGPLDPDRRDGFLQAVAHALQQDCAGEVGPGTVARVCRELQRQFFDPGGLDPVTLPWQHMPHGPKPNPCREAAALSRPAQGGDANES